MFSTEKKLFLLHQDLREYLAPTYEYRTVIATEKKSVFYCYYGDFHNLQLPVESNG